MSREERRRRALDEAERALWRVVIRSVAPLKRKRMVIRDEDERSSERKAKVTIVDVAGVQTHPKPARKSSTAKPSAPPLVALDRRAKQRLARGNEAIDARIDLHGRTQSEAHAALLRFLARAQANGARTVLVITGKGVRSRAFSSERGVLRRQVPLWLRLPEFRGYVLGIEQAHITHGGEGALYVRLRRGR